MADYRTVVDDLLKFVEFIDWLDANYPELLPLHSKSLYFENIEVRMLVRDSLSGCYEGGFLP